MIGEVLVMIRVGECGVGSLRTCSFFSGSRRVFLKNFDKKYRTLTCRDKRESHLIFCNKIIFRYAKKERLASFLASMALCDCHSGSLWLSQTFTDSLWLLLDLSLSLSGSLWLSVTPTLALTGSHCHSLAYSGPLWLTIAL